MLNFAPIDPNEPCGLPNPNPNGGLYTGIPADPKSGYAAYPVTPDISYLMTETIKSANPPPQYLYTFGLNRNGNNNLYPVPGTSTYDPKYGLITRNN